MKGVGDNTEGSSESPRQTPLHPGTRPQQGRERAPSHVPLCPCAHACTSRSHLGKRPEGPGKREAQDPWPEVREGRTPAHCLPGAPLSSQGRVLRGPSKGFEPPLHGAGPVLTLLCRCAHICWLVTFHSPTAAVRPIGVLLPQVLGTKLARRPGPEASSVALTQQLLWASFTNCTGQQGGGSLEPGADAMWP